MTDRHTATPTERLGGLPKLTDAQVADLEAKNGLIQFDVMNELIAAAVSGGQFVFTPGQVCKLQHAAVDGLEPTAGKLREVNVTIGGALHQPPPHEQVPMLVDEMCRYVNDHWQSNDALQLSAYAMWRMNWIHPFTNGNGRTSRAVSYMILCAKLGFRLPGNQTVPEMIAANKKPYYAALEAADAAWKQGQVDVSQMEFLLAQHLAKQLTP